jgi:hypothetical protein
MLLSGNPDCRWLASTGHELLLLDLTPHLLHRTGIKNSSTAGLFRVLKIARSCIRYFARLISSLAEHLSELMLACLVWYRFLKIARLWRLGRFVSKVKEVLDLNPALVRMAQVCLG